MLDDKLEVRHRKMTKHFYLISKSVANPIYIVCFQ